jgi:hypothetical protein
MTDLRRNGMLQCRKTGAMKHWQSSLKRKVKRLQWPFVASPSSMCWVGYWTWYWMVRHRRTSSESHASERSFRNGMVRLVTKLVTRRFALGFKTIGHLASYSLQTTLGETVCLSNGSAHVTVTYSRPHRYLRVFLLSFPVAQPLAGPLQLPERCVIRMLAREVRRTISEDPSTARRCVIVRTLTIELESTAWDLHLLLTRGLVNKACRLIARESSDQPSPDSRWWSLDRIKSAYVQVNYLADLA